ncbi:MAG: AEC family transporter [Candidatus Omnitrophota bacterium]
MQIFLLGSLGFYLRKKDIISSVGLDGISRFTIEIALPAFIFCQLIKNFDFSLYQNWWLFPILSFVITIIGILVGFIFIKLQRRIEEKREFLSLVTFQNSGYLPLALVAGFLSTQEANQMFIYIFLFLFGFNLIIWSLGMYMLGAHRVKKFELGSLFSPPVLATLVAFLFIVLGIRIIPNVIFKPMEMVGNCMLPLALLIVGGGLAEIRFDYQLRKTTLINLILAKLIILPSLALMVLYFLKLPTALGLLIIIEAAVPSATTLSIIERHYQKEGILVNQGIFITHLASLVTIPIFLSLYFWLTMLK